jgi:O-methyltransferase
MTDPRQDRRSKFLATTYEAFRHDARRAIFLRIAVFRNQCAPIDGYYFEFGCHTGRTMRLAFDAFDDLFDQTYVGFDSFEGFPTISPEDKMPIWCEGTNATSEGAFRAIVTAHGLPPDRLITVKGFYGTTLTPDLAARFLPTKAAVILVDCDLYASTVPVLEFVVPFLQRGTVLVFDDWFQFHGDPDRGQRRAFREFRESHPDLRFVDFFENGEVKALIVLEPGDSGARQP